MTRKNVSAYDNQSKKSLGDMQPSQADGWAMIEVARRLEEAKGKPDDVEGARSALRLNWRIWTIIQAELTEEHCELPEEVRVNLFALSNFIDKQTLKALADFEPSLLDVLVTINRQIGSGLMGDPGPGLEGKEMPDLHAERKPPPSLPDHVNLKELSDEEVAELAQERKKRRQDAIAGSSASKAKDKDKAEAEAKQGQDKDKAEAEAKAAKAPQGADKSADKKK